MMDPGTVENGLLFRRQLVHPFAVALLGCEMLAYGACGRTRSVLIKHRPSIVIGCPGHRTVRGRLGKQQHITRLHRHLFDQTHVILA